jgi:hypothetical protein
VLGAGSPRSWSRDQERGAGSGRRLTLRPTGRDRRQLGAARQPACAGDLGVLWPSSGGTAPWPSTAPCPPLDPGRPPPTATASPSARDAGGRRAGRHGRRRARPDHRRGRPARCLVPGGVRGQLLPRWGFGRRLDAVDDHLRSRVLPPRGRRQRLPRAAGAADRGWLRGHGRSDGLAAVHAPLRRRLRRRPVRAGPGPCRGPEGHRRDPDLVDADGRRRQGDVHGRHARRPHLRLPAGPPAALRADQHRADLDHERRQVDRPRLRRDRRPGAPARRRRPPANDAALARPRDGHRPDRRRRRAPARPDRRRGPWRRHGGRHLRHRDHCHG